MEKRIFTIVAVVILGVLLGVGIVSQQAKDPLLRELLKKQAQILENQAKIEKKLVVLEEQNKAFQTAFLQKISGAVAQERPTPQPQEDMNTVHEIPVAHTPVMGKKDAPITIVEFVDFQCPFCARFHPPVIEVTKMNPDKVNYMIKNFPLSFHPMAKPAAKAAFAAGEQGKYEEMANELMLNYNQLSEEKFQELAKRIGLNVEKFKKDYKEKDSQWEEYIQADINLGSKVGVRGTPTFFINGQQTSARDVAGFEAEINSILEKNM